MGKAILIKWDGTTSEVEPKNGKTFSLEELQSFVKGYIEMVETRDGRTMVLNEEGKINGNLPNNEATKLIDFDDVIYGDVLVCDNSFIE